MKVPGNQRGSARHRRTAGRRKALRRHGRRGRGDHRSRHRRGDRQVEARRLRLGRGGQHRRLQPVADRLRIIGRDGTNLRVNVDDGKVTVDGKLKFAETDMHKGEMPNIVAGAYTNSMKGAKETALFDIDGTIGGLIKQARRMTRAQRRRKARRGRVPATPSTSCPEGGRLERGLPDVGDTLHRVDLATGKATMAKKVSGLDGAVRDIAAMPKM